MNGESETPMPVDDETLVAYLDGELPREDITAVEHLLRTDVELRRRVDKLRITWDLLGELPDTRPRPEFAQSTIEMVSLAIAQDKRIWWKRLLGSRWVLMMTGALLAFAVGGLAAEQRTRTQRNQLLGDLPILVMYENLRLVDSKDWMEKLSTISELKLAANDPHNVVEPTEVPETNVQRIEWLKKLSGDTRTQLAEVRSAFQREPPPRRDELREIALLLPVEIEDAPGINLGQLLATYASILDQVGTAERAELNSIENLDERAEQVTKLIRRERAIAHATHLSPPDRESFRIWNDSIIDELYDFFSRFENPDAKVVDEMYRPPEKSYVTNEDVDRLRTSLSRESQDLLNGLDANLQRDVLGRWLIDVVIGGGTSAAVLPAAELKRRFDQLSNDKKLELEFLSEREIRQRLSVGVD